jgi:hypothetical protein
VAASSWRFRALVEITIRTDRMAGTANSVAVIPVATATSTLAVPTMSPVR